MRGSGPEGLPICPLDGSENPAEVLPDVVTAPNLELIPHSIPHTTITGICHIGHDTNQRRCYSQTILNGIHDMDGISGPQHIR